MSETLQPVTRGRLYHSAKVSNCFRPQATKASITLLINSCFRFFLLSFFFGTYAVFVLKKEKETHMLKLASEFFIHVGLRGPCSLFHDLIAVYISVDHERLRHVATLRSFMLASMWIRVMLWLG